MNYWQQGDTIYFQIEELPKKLEKQRENIIQHGEHGNFHRLRDGDIFIQPKTKEKYLHLVKPSEVFHEEHGPVTLPPGAYRIGIVREKGMFDDLIAPVVD